jgi:hypothetical protein
MGVAASTTTDSQSCKYNTADNLQVGALLVTREMAATSDPLLRENN